MLSVLPQSPTARNHRRLSVVTAGAGSVYEQHLLLRNIRKRQEDSSEKLIRFFGDIETPIPDVSLKDVKKIGLAAALESKAVLCYFLLFLLQEHSYENLFFVYEVEHYETFSFVSLDQRISTAQYIYDSYLRIDSVLELNILPSAAKTASFAIESRNEDLLKTCFKPALCQVFDMLETCFLSWRVDSGSTWRLMLDELDENANYRTKQTMIKAIGHILVYLSANYNFDSADYDSSDDSSRAIKSRRDRIVKNMTHAFLKHCLGFDLDS